MSKLLLALQRASAPIAKGSKFIGHQMPETIFMQPNRVRVTGDKFIDRQTVNQWLAWNALLLSVHKDDLVLPLSFAAGFSFGGRALALWLWHGILIIRDRP